MFDRCVDLVGELGRGRWPAVLSEGFVDSQPYVFKVHKAKVAVSAA